MNPIDPKRIERYLKLRARATDPSSSGQERDIALRVCAKMETEYPGIEYAMPPEPEPGAPWMGQPPESPRRGSGPIPGGAPQAAPIPPESAWKGKLREWFADTVEQVTRGLSLSDQIDADVSIEISANQRTVHVKIKIPIEDALQVAEDSQGSLQEYARLVGLKVGRDLSEYFEDCGY